MLCFCFQTWLDSRLNWTDNILYNNDIQAIYSTESTVFTPPIVVENSVSDLGLIRDLTLPIEILKTGDITWTPGDVYDTSCDIDTTYYPFDVQTCVITLTTRGYSNNQLSLKLGGNPIVQSAYQENGEWTLVTTSSSTSIAHHDLVPYSQINFSFTFKRRIAFHLMNTIIPMVLLVSMTCYVFKIPVDAGEKLGYCLTVLLAFAVYLTLVSDNIPTTSTHICYLSVYLNVMLAFGVTSVLLTIHILDIHFKPEDKKIPGYFRAFMKFSSRVCCWHEAKCCNKGHTEVSVIAVTEKENEVNRKNSDIENTEESFTWQEIAKKMDEFLFFMYASIFIVFTVIFVIIMMIGSSM
ncbi:neuronal acetylcholine receptor subunit alpha-3-like [Ostrea edulis]|uniref:neuronal acetylcholine receptor subunit alpha-3-like n=1 Tax=Ostrea edulis TaxID=37623 RepID=UPI002095E4ED|nr:neuronal acetylcholine receptor subunit alpha-3-like [Ostrea edulis]